MLIYQNELKVCSLTADRGISFAEARALIRQSNNSSRKPLIHPSPPMSQTNSTNRNIPNGPNSSLSEFPALPKYNSNQPSRETINQSQLYSQAVSQSIPFSTSEQSEMDHFPPEQPMNSEKPSQQNNNYDSSELSTQLPLPTLSPIQTIDEQQYLSLIHI